MNKIKMMGLGLALGLCANIATAGEGVDFKLTAYQQGDEFDWEATSSKATVVKVKITTKDIMELIGHATATTIPSGAYFYFEPDSDVYEILDKNGDVVVDLSDMEGGSPIEISSGDEIYSGTYKDDGEKGNENTQSTSYVDVWFDLGGYDLWVGGLMKSKYSDNWSSKGYKTKSSGKAAVSGDGWVGESDALLEGTVSFQDSSKGS